LNGHPASSCARAILTFDTLPRSPAESKGYSITLPRALCGGHLLNRWDRTDVGELRDALAAIIGRNDEEVGRHPSIVRRDECAATTTPAASSSAATFVLPLVAGRS